MSEILNELQEVKKASQEQTAASQAQTAEVAGKMEEIDRKVAESQKKFDEFVGGDFDSHVADALALIVYVDPVGGNDANEGYSSSIPIRSSSRLYDLVYRLDYQYVYVYVKRDSEFILSNKLKAKMNIILSAYGDGERPIIRQGLVSYATIFSPLVDFRDVNVYTYQAPENEAITPPKYQSRALLMQGCELRAKNANIHICDNQLFHVHNGGSGDFFSQNKISLSNSEFVSEPSNLGVTGAIKTVYTYFASAAAYPPVDLFGAYVTVKLNGVHANLQDFLACHPTYLRTNLTLS